MSFFRETASGAGKVSDGVSASSWGTRVALLLLLSSFRALVPGANAADSAADFLNDYLKKKQIPGCAVMVRHEGKVVLSEGYASPTWNTTSG